jgi:hypothetical protein
MNYVFDASPTLFCIYSMTAVPLGSSKPHLLIYGGISHRAAIDTLEVCVIYVTICIATSSYFVHVFYVCTAVCTRCGYVTFIYTYLRLMRFMHHICICTLLTLLQIVEVNNTVANSFTEADDTSYESVCKDITVATEQRFPRRFGNSCTLLQHLTTHDAATGVYECTCLVAGGSNGSDLLRNGQDFQDIWLLKLQAKTQLPSTSTATTVISDSSNNSITAEWTPITVFADTVRPAQYTLGRCHTAELVGKKVLFFGGSARLNNTIQEFDTDKYKVRRISCLQKKL